MNANPCGKNLQNYPEGMGVTPVSIINQYMYTWMPFQIEIFLVSTQVFLKTKDIKTVKIVGSTVSFWTKIEE